MLVGATLASSVDRAIDDTITPIAIGYFDRPAVPTLGPFRPPRVDARSGCGMMMRRAVGPVLHV